MKKDNKQNQEPDPIKTRVIEIADKAREAGIEVYPQVYNIVAVNDGGHQIMLYTEVHYTKEEAIAAFETKVAVQTGIPATQWRIKVVTMLTADLIEQKFTEHADKIKIEKKRNKNALMKEIIDNKDTNLLHRNYSRFSNVEILYMHDKIVEK